MQEHKGDFTIEEMELLEVVKNMTDYKGLCRFFNRGQRTIRNAVYQLAHKRKKYIYRNYNKQLSK